MTQDIKVEDVERYCHIDWRDAFSMHLSFSYHVGQRVRSVGEIRQQPRAREVFLGQTVILLSSLPPSKLQRSCWFRLSLNAKSRRTVPAPGHGSGREPIGRGCTDEQSLEWVCLFGRINLAPEIVVCPMISSDLSVCM